MANAVAAIGADDAQLPSRPPVPTDPGESARWAGTRLRRRLLSGQWKDDLVARVRQEVGPIRREVWGEVKTHVNLFRSSTREVSACYAVRPDVRAGEGEIPPALARPIEAAGLWAMMPRFQQLTIGCRQYLWRVNVLPGGAVRHRAVPPDLVIAHAAEDAPSVPVRIEEARWRKGLGWCWDIVDVADPRRPEYRVQTVRGRDVSADLLGGRLDGDAYPYRRADGTPILPYALYHADSLGDRLWDWQDGIETVEGTFDVGVYSTMLGHVIKDASWPQRYTIGAYPAGASTESDGGGDGDAGRARREVVTDPASLLILVSDPSYQGQPLVGQWQAGADPEKLEAVISALANRIAIDAGLPPSDIQRMGGTARSGYAISLSNEGKRVAARRYSPTFQRGDVELLTITAILLNRATGAGLPEDGYTVIHRELPLSPDEQRERRANVLELMDRGLMSPVDAHMELSPGMTRAQAAADLVRIAEETRAVRMLAEIPPPKGQDTDATPAEA